jgi:hypothetical protein
MRSGQPITDHVVRQVTSTTTSFSTNSGYFFSVPRGKCFDDAECFYNLVSSLSLVGEKLLSSVDAKINDKGSCKKGQNGILLKLI